MSAATRNGATDLFVSVVIPVLDAEDSLDECLSSLLRVEYPEDRREILVVDNGSTDRTAEIIRSYPVQYLKEERRGPSRARNHGIVKSTGDIVAFTDGDCLPTKGWLHELVQGFQRDDVGGVAGEILSFPPTTGAERFAARVRHLSPRIYLNRPIFPFAVTANLAFRRSVIERVGLLDPDSPRGGESTDYCTRFFRQSGLRLEFAPRAIVFHKHRSSTRAFLRQQFGYGRGHAYLYDKYRADIPWGWRQTLQVYADLARSGARLAAAATARTLNRGTAADLELAYFDFLRKLALRTGFAREALSRGHLWL